MKKKKKKTHSTKKKKKSTYTRYHADGRVEKDVALPDGRQYITEVDEMQALIGGGQVETMRLPGGLLALFDEDGRSKQLPLNRTASALVTKLCGGMPCLLVGTVVVMPNKMLK
jgi:flagellar hook assembly protein FlgD